MNEEQLMKLMSKRLRPAKCGWCDVNYYPSQTNQMFCSNCQCRDHSFEKTRPRVVVGLKK